MFDSITELVITSGGKNIAPVPIENEIKEKVPFLSNVMVVGDHRKYITCLVTLKVRSVPCSLIGTLYHRTRCCIFTCRCGDGSVGEGVGRRGEREGKRRAGIALSGEEEGWDSLEWRRGGLG